MRPCIARSALDQALVQALLTFSSFAWQHLANMAVQQCLLGCRKARSRARTVLDLEVCYALGKPQIDVSKQMLGWPAVLGHHAAEFHAATESAAAGDHDMG